MMRNPRVCCLHKDYNCDAYVVLTDDETKVIKMSGLHRYAPPRIKVRELSKTTANKDTKKGSTYLSSHMTASIRSIFNRVICL